MHIKPTFPASMALGAIATLALITTPVKAQDRYYLGVDLHAWHVSPDRGSSWRDIGIRGRFGGRLAENFALEAHLATGGSDRENGVPLELDHLAGVFLRGDIPVTRYTSLYGLAGFSQVKLTVDGSSDSDSSISFGFGVDHQVTGNTHVSLDWIRYVNETDYDYSALSVGARWSF